MKKILSKKSSESRANFKRGSSGLQNNAQSMAEDGISVLMSVYRNEKADYFREAMESILHQTRMPDEIVLMEDGPLYEELERCIREYEASCPILKVYRIKENVQLGRALRKGACLCRYEMIARMDTDDIAAPDRLEKQYAFLAEQKDVSAVGGWILEFNDENTLHTVKKMPETNDEIRRYGTYRSPLNHMTVMMRRSDLLACGNYRHFVGLEDYYLWMRMMASGKKLYCLPEVLVKVRANSDVYRRRGGFSYMLRYLKLRRMQRELGLTHGLSYLKAVAITVGITAIPPGMRRLVYKAVLRRS